MPSMQSKIERFSKRPRKILTETSSHRLIWSISSAAASRRGEVVISQLMPPATYIRKHLQGNLIYLTKSKLTFPSNMSWRTTRALFQPAQSRITIRLIIALMLGGIRQNLHRLTAFFGNYLICWRRLIIFRLETPHSGLVCLIY
jgi:hypothetical protein